MARKRKRITAGESAAIYARYSSHNQKDASIEQQVEQATKYAAELGLEIVAVYADRAISGKTDRRPNFQRMMRDAESGKFRVLVAWKSNRIGRNMLQAMQNEQRLQDAGISVLYTEEEFDDTAAGRFAARSMMNVNQFYSENMAEDVKRGMIDNALRCKVASGAIPYGYKSGNDLKYEIDEPKAEVVREIYRRVLHGDPYVDIANDLNARGLKTRMGNPWNKGSFHTILRNECYTGVYIYEDIRIEGGVPVIIDKDLFYQVQEALKMRKMSGRRSSAGADYILTGKLFCGYCKSPMVGLSGTSKAGDLHYYYACQGKRTKKNCRKENIRKEDIEKTVAAAIKSSLHDPEVVAWIADQAVAYSEKQLQLSDVAILEAELSDVKTSLKNLLNAIEQGIITSTTRARMLELEQEQARLSAKISAERSSLVSVSREDVIAWISIMREGETADKKYQAQLVNNFLRAVYCYDDHLKIFFSFDKDNRGIDIDWASEIADSIPSPADAECSYKLPNGSPETPPCGGKTADRSKNGSVCCFYQNEDAVSCRKPGCLGILLSICYVPSMRPSFIFRMVSACSATAGSWVTTITQRPSSWASFLRISTMFLLFSLSKLPVGSSAKIISLPAASDRAIATRCCSPPESVLGKRGNCSAASPTRSRLRLACSWAAVFFIPRITSG